MLSGCGKPKPPSKKVAKSGRWNLQNRQFGIIGLIKWTINDPWPTQIKRPAHTSNRFPDRPDLAVKDELGGMAGTTESWDLIFGGVDQVSASEPDFHFSRKSGKCKILTRNKWDSQNMANRPERAPKEPKSAQMENSGPKWRIQDPKPMWLHLNCQPHANTSPR